MHTVSNRGTARRNTATRHATNGARAATFKPQGNGARALQATLLATALMGAYGTAGAADVTLRCTPVCVPADPTSGADYSKTSTSNAADSSNDWVVYGSSGANFTLDGGTVTATGARLRGVLATGASQILMNGVEVETNPTAYDASAGWGAHGVQAVGAGSVVTINDSSITTNGPGTRAVAVYSEGIQASEGGAVTGAGNTISTSGSGSYGIEAFDGGTISLTGGTITTSGKLASGVRTYTGSGATLGAGVVTLDGTTINTSGESASGLLAGDSDEPTAGIINATNVTINTTGKNSTGIQANYGEVHSTGSTITTSGSGAHAAEALNGSSITLDGDTLSAGLGYGLYASGAGSSITANNTTVETANGSYGVLAENGGQVSLSGGSVTNAGTLGDKMTIYANGAGTSVTTQDVALTNAAAGGGTGDLSNVVSAASQATVTLNGGSVVSEGSTFGRGILASAGASVTANDVDISTIGTLSNAVHAYSGRQDLADTTPDTPSITLNGATVSTTGANSYGLFAQNKGSTISATGNTIVTTTGANSFGAVAYNGGALNLAGVSVTTSGSGADGIAINELLGAQSPGHVPTPNYGSTLTLSDSSVTSEKANGIYVGSGSNALINNTNILAARHGVVVKDGASVAMAGGSIASTGDEQHAVMVDGSSSSFSASNVAISAAGSIDNRGDVTHAIDLTNGATATVTDGSIKTTGANFTTGIFVATNSTATANNVAISTTGDTGVGVRAYSAYEKASEIPIGTTASQTAYINGGSITTSGVESYGLWAQDMGSHIVAGSYTDPTNSSVTPLTITTSGKDAYGVAVYGGADASLTDVTINTSGVGASGVALNTLGSRYHPTRASSVAATFSMSGGSINTTGADTAAVTLLDSATASFSGTTLNSAGATFTSTFAQAGQAQSITLGNGTSAVNNNGTLLGVTRTGDGADGTITLALQDGSFAQGNVYDPTAAGKVTVTKGADAHWAGLVVDSSTQTVDPDSNPTQTGFSSDGNVIIGSTTPVDFTGTTSVGGDFSGATGGSTTFSGPTDIAGNLIGAPGSTTNFTDSANIGSVTGGSGSSISFTGSSTNIQGDVSGNQGTQINFSKGGSTNIGGSISLSGNGTSTHGGTTDNPIIVQGDVNVGNGALLGGNIMSNGSLGGSGGTVGPGNSVGVQSYASSAGFTGNYFAEVNAAGKSDLLIIRSGNFDLSGIGLTVGQENRNGGYVLNHRYTIIQTPGGSVVNKFASTGLDSSFDGTLVKLDPIIYDPQDVQVTLSVDNSAVDNKRAGLSKNQNATLDGVLSVAGQNAAADAALQSTDTGGVLNQLSGEVHASTQAALLSTGDLLVRTLTDRMRANLGAPMVAGAPVAAAGELPSGAMPRSSALPLWAQVVGDWQSLKGGSDGAANSKLSLAGLYLGGDTQVGTSGWRVGAALGYTNGRLNVDDRDSRSDLDSYTASIYGGKSWEAGKGHVNFLAGAAYTRNNVDSRRNVNVGGNQALKASYHADSAQLFTELGYAMPMSRSASIEPYARLAWINQRTQSFDESGGPAALHGDSSTDNLTTLTLGLRGATELAVGAHAARLTGGLGWRHAGGDVNPKTSLSFIQGSGTSFSVAGAPIAKDAAVVDLGAEMAVGKRAAMGLSYSGQYGAGNADSAGSLYLKMHF